MGFMSKPQTPRCQSVLFLLCLMCARWFYPHMMNPKFDSFYPECRVGYQEDLRWSLPLWLDCSKIPGSDAHRISWLERMYRRVQPQ